METTRTLNVKNELIDPSVENARPEICNMSILIDKDGLVFSILRNDLKKFIVLADYERLAQTGYKDLFAFRDRLPGDFNQINLGFLSDKVAIVPIQLFEKDEIKRYAEFQFEVKNDEVLQYDLLKTHDIALICAIPEELTAQAGILFDKYPVRHAGFFTIDYYLNLYKNKAGEFIHLYVAHHIAEIIVIRNGKLLLYNVFEYQSNDDLLYIVLNIFEQTELNTESVPVKISGSVERKSEIWLLFENYIRFVESESRPEGYVYSHEFKNCGFHEYNHVFQMATCV